MRASNYIYNQPRGLTMIELMITLAVLAILATIAVPSMQKIIRDNRVSGQTNDLISLINLTRNEAIRRNINIADPDREAILRLSSKTSSAGWSGSVSVTGEESDDACPPDVIRCSDHEKVNLTTGDATLAFEARGFLEPFELKVMCLKHSGENCTGTRQHTEIRVFGTGQIKTEQLACDAPCPRVANQGDGG